MNTDKILRMGHPVLTQTSESVKEFANPQLDRIIQELVTIMQENHGAGIAAPQLGYNKRIIAYGFDFNPRYPNEKPVSRTVLVNPEYTPLSSETDEQWEGCLSIPGLRGLVSRYSRIIYQAYNAYGQKIEGIADGFAARIIQHECDHLDGILFPQRIKDLQMFGYEDMLEERTIQQHAA